MTHLLTSAEGRAGEHWLERLLKYLLIAERFPELEHPPRGEITLDVAGPPAGTPGGAPDVPPNVLIFPRSDAEDGGVGNSDDSPSQEDEDPLWAA